MYCRGAGVECSPRVRLHWRGIRLDRRCDIEVGDGGRRRISGCLAPCHCPRERARRANMFERLSSPRLKSELAIYPMAPQGSEFMHHIITSFISKCDEKRSTRGWCQETKKKVYIKSYLNLQFTHQKNLKKNSLFSIYNALYVCIVYHQKNKRTQNPSYIPKRNKLLQPKQANTTQLVYSICVVQPQSSPTSHANHANGTPPLEFYIPTHITLESPLTRGIKLPNHSYIHTPTNTTAPTIALTIPPSTLLPTAPP